LPAELYTLDVARTDVVVAQASSTPATVNDAAYEDAVGATVDPSYDVSVREVTPGATGGGTFVCDTPGVATVTSHGHVDRVADGVATVRYVAPRLVRVLSLSTARTVGQATRTFTGFVVGSMARAAAAAIDARIAGKNPATDNAVFAVADHASSTYAYNPTRWCAGLDLTCRAVWNNWSNSAQMAGCLITRRHVVCSNHFSPIFTRADLRFRFVGSDGVAVERQVVPAYGGATLGTYGVEGYGGDATIMTLDADVPVAVTPARFLDPATVAAKLPSLRRYAYNADGSVGATGGPATPVPLPVLMTDQDLHAHVVEWSAHATNDYATAPQVRPSMTSYNLPSVAARRPFYEGWVDFDSSSPAFLFDGNPYAILHTTASFGGSGAGPNYSAPTMQQRIRAYLAADVAAPGYDIAYADTAAFTSF
jgi:hypothetical protein